MRLGGKRVYWVRSRVCKDAIFARPTALHDGVVVLGEPLLALGRWLRISVAPSAAAAALSPAVFQCLLPSSI